MAKKKKNIETTIVNYYDLKVDKVDELVAALTDSEHQFEDEVSMYISDCTGQETSDTMTKTGKRKQFDPYKHDLLARIPVFIKALLIKWWFGGVICYFINMGLGVYITDTLDLFVITGVVMGVVVDLFVNPIFHFLETDQKEYNYYMMFPFPFKAFWTFFANMIYYILVTTGVLLCYTGVNLLLVAINPKYYLAMEPVLFGVFCVISDMVFIGVKDIIVFLVKKIIKSKKEKVNV